ncbi:M64 family metallopeptidase [Inquilinus sp. NPDC058860]|uniref:M64 family metallopeptidase n=1 Tax=Inquilinus sp. NPDC058860 TaxID=3346652 RepID=UPI00368E318D
MPLPIERVEPVAFWLRGSPFDRTLALRIAILSEGFLPNEMQAFREAADGIVTALRDHPPFNRHWDRIGIVRIDCRSEASATVLQPLHAPPAGYWDRTPFDVHFDPGIARSLQGDASAVRHVLWELTGLPAFDSVLVLVNSQHPAGVAPDSVAFLTLHGSTNARFETFVHELGHAAFGLADEYEIRTGAPGEPVHAVRNPPEPAEPNITAQRRRGLIPWQDALTPGVQIPTTVASPPGGCVRDKAARPHVPPLPARAIGLFEGGGQVSCGLFRPALGCLMRGEGEALFCDVCERHIDRWLAAHAITAATSAAVAEERWTHMVPFDGNGLSLAIAYHAPSGRITAYDVSRLADRGSPVLTPIRDVTITGGFTAMAVLAQGVARYLLLTNLFTDQRVIYRIDLFPTPGTNPWLDLVLATHSAPVPGYSHVVPFELDGGLYVLHYGRITGELALQEIDFSAGVAIPNTIASSRAGTLAPWRPLLSGLAVVDIDGLPYLAGVDAAQRTIAIAALRLPSGPAPASMLTETFTAGPEFIRGLQTHAAGLSVHGRGALCLYSALGGGMAIYRPRKGGAGLDFEFGMDWPPGAAALFDVGLPALGALGRLDNGVGPRFELVWLYNAGLQRFFTVHLR